MSDNPRNDPSADENRGSALSSEDGRGRVPATLEDADNDISFVILIAGIAAVAAIFFVVCWFYVTAKISAFSIGTDVITAHNSADAVAGLVG